MRKLIGVITVVAALAIPGTAFAGNSGTGAEYGTQPGFDVAQANTICSGHGAFGYFGKDNNLSGGANGYLTGINNSPLCGNRQGNL